MALATFTPPRAPSPGTARKIKPKLLKAEFGDGYTQVAGDGTNYIKSSTTLTWEVLTPTESTAIDAFLRAQGAGVTPFYYTLSDDPSPTRWTCEEWQIERGQGGLRKVTLTLTEYFGVLT